MRKRKRLLGISLILIIIAALYGVYKYVNFTYGTYLNSGIAFNDTNQSTMAELKDMVTGGPWTQAITKVGNLQADYQKAHSINPDTVGWIFVNGTNINYPIMYNQNDNNYYLTHNWKNESYWNGSIFLDSENTGFNNVSLINGHNMLNGIMFSQLMNYRNKDFFEGNHDVYIYDGIDQKYEEFKPIGAIYCEPNINLTLGNLTEQQRTEEVNTLMSKSIYGKQPYNGNGVLLLNTCLSNGSGEHQLLITEQVPYKSKS